MRKIFVLAALIFSFNVNCSAAEIISTAENDWSLSILEDEGEYYFSIYDDKNDRGAVVEYSHELYDFYLSKSSAVVFIMAVKDSPKDIDVELGEWSNDAHLLPVYVVFDYIDGELDLYDIFASDTGLFPEEFQGTLESPYHKDLVRNFLLLMPKLHEVVEQNEISLP